MPHQRASTAGLPAGSVGVPLAPVPQEPIA
jgi:hypothetical protein